MISLKKYLDMDMNIRESNDSDVNELLAATLVSYRSALLAMGQSGVRACPAIGSDLYRKATN